MPRTHDTKGIANLLNTTERNFHRWAEREKWNVSSERIETLRSVIADPYRENEEGDTVAVRQKPKEPTREERAEFWFTIRKSGLFDQRSDGSRFLDRNGFQWESFMAYICERFNVKADGIPHQLSMTQLKKIHNWILTDDPEVIARCQELQRETDVLSVARKNCADWHDKVLRAFGENLSPTPGNVLTPAHNRCLKEFEKVVKQRFDGFDFDAQHAAVTCDQLLAVQQVFSDIYSDIELNEDWVRAFKATFSDKLAKGRKALEQAWADARTEMFNALEEYPRDVSKHTFLTRFDTRFGHPIGRTKSFTEPTPAITDETLTADIRHFKAATADIRADTDWMQAMPVPIPLIAALTEARITELHIKIEGGGENTRIAEFDRDTAAEWIPAELQEKLIKLANRFIYSD